jgi:formate dehydrogenase iron-sulfur subunit
MADSQSLDIRRRSASTELPPNIREATQVAKLIDVSRCIGCKACQAACMEWNDLREEEVGSFNGSYDNPADLSPASWTLMRFTEWEDPQGNLEWLIRKDGCMHCGDPGCLKACPSPGAIVQYQNGIVDFISENCIGCGYCIKGCPFNIPRLSQADQKVYKCTLCSDRVAVGHRRLAMRARPARSFGTKHDMTECRGTHRDRSRAASIRRDGRSAGVGGTHRDTCCTMRTSLRSCRPPDDPHISRLVQAWKGVMKPIAMAGLAFTAVVGFVHWMVAGPNEVHPEDEAKGRDVLDRQDT